MTPFAVAGIQMFLGMHNNLEQMRNRLDVLMHLYPWTQMVLFSELAPRGPALASAQAAGGHDEQAFREMARRHRVWLVPGSMFEKRDGAIYNTTLVIDPEGEVIARYRKMFPFAPYEEGTKPGREFCLFEVPEVGRFGIAICYDIWFPEVARTLTSMGAEVILNPSMANFIDRFADLAIAQATGAMFQTYVFHVNGLGVGGNGQSMIVDPTGRVLHQAEGHEAFMPIEIDLDIVRRQRERGLLGLGQPLKSFRDCEVDFTVYDRERFDRSYLDGLGPLAKPGRAGGEAAVRRAAE
ncbi:MAG TPA: carbon-nitrogen hydrolase family protein [Paracoccaceae bacterium]|nr:carbon-nitrogen hydrolase family protein [Paracoccaceae bacterium]